MLVCNKHNIRTPVSKKDDFINVKEGGCREICDEMLKCGHECTKVCHSLDKNHEQYKCFENCLR